MKLRDRIAALNRLQQGRLFKLVASGLIALAAIGSLGFYVVTVNAPATERALAEQRAEASNAAPDPAGDDEGARLGVGSAESARRAIDEILSARSDPTAVGLGIASVAAIALATVWLGLGLTYLLVLLLAAAVAVPLALWPPTREFGLALGGLAALVLSFTALLQALRLGLSGPGPVSSIARNVLTEAVRLRISLVFIIVLLILLAALPGLLDDSQPLRYRVQSFLSFGTGLSFWVIAVLTLVFSAATVSFEQRDRIIWQTMTKPVSPWQYVLGKWLGVVGLNAVLLAVCASAVFLFVEYLRNQPAIGEVAPYVAAGYDEVSEDRLALETQVLTARVVRDIDPIESVDDPSFQAEVGAYIEDRQRTSPDFAGSPEQRAEVAASLHKSLEQMFRAAGPGQLKRFTFSGLAEARAANRPLTLRLRADVGTNSPDDFRTIGIAFGPMPLLPERLGAGLYHTIPLTPVAVLSDGSVVRVDEADFRAIRVLIERGDMPGRVYTTRDLVEEDGTLQMIVVNARPEPDPRSGQMIPVANDETIAFPSDGLALSFTAGSYRANFFRAMVGLWIKLAFLAIVAIFASTFLSFPVACLVAFGVFFAAETSTYLLDSLESFSIQSREGELQVFRAVSAGISYGVAFAFRLYDELNPLGELVQGRLIPWHTLLLRGVVLALATGVLGVLATISMRRRELGLYSGR